MLLKREYKIKNKFIGYATAVLFIGAPQLLMAALIFIHMRYFQDQGQGIIVGYVFGMAIAGAFKLKDVKVVVDG